jgi:cysteine-S-conjugate beta-lyase
VVPDFLIPEADLRARGGGKWTRYPPEVLPAFVADMDFEVAPAVQAALRHFTDTQDYGYGQMNDPDALHEAFAEWMRRRHAWSPDPALTIANTDVVQGIVSMLTVFTEPGDGVISQTPIYPPFLTYTEKTGRRLVENPLLDDGRRFTVDVEGLDRAAAGARLLLLCNPHNPTGRVLERAELEAIAGIAADHDLVIVADEIHADLVYPGATHVPMESIPGAAERTVTLTSATKGFNVAGIRTSIAHFGTAELKARFDAAIAERLVGGPSRFGIAATVAAWREGEAWLGDVMAYLDRNRRRVADWADSMSLGHHLPEATYLAWLDCRRLELPDDVSAYDYFLERARVGLSNGSDFGGPGRGHVRLNFATSETILEEILARLSTVLD